MGILPSHAAKADTFCLAVRDLALLPVFVLTKRSRDVMNSAMVLNLKCVCIHVAQAFQHWPWMYSKDADLACVGLHVSSCNN